MYPDYCFTVTPKITVLDVGCGYGGVLCALGERYPDKLCLGLELRVKVSEYTQKLIEFSREQTKCGQRNVCCLRANAMRYLPYFFEKNQLEIVVIAFPDPHFKASKQKRRIISKEMLPEFAYLMAPGAYLYTITDVEELANDMQQTIDNFPLFKRVNNWEEDGDKHREIRDLLVDKSDEAKKANLRSGESVKFNFAAYERVNGFC